MPRLLASAAVAGHFGELLQGRLGPGGPVALVTLPAPGLVLRARLLQGGPIAVHAPGGRPLLPAQAALLAQSLGAPPSGRLILAADMPPGGGAGASTAALLATAAVLAAAAGRPLPGPAALAALCRALEGATDPLMHPDPGRLLWAPRQARILGHLPALPGLEVVGGWLGPGRRTDPADDRFADVADLVAAWAPAAARGDLPTLGALATESARRNAGLRGGPDPAPLIAAAGRLGALGIVAAHTGSARGLLFAPGGAPVAEAAAALRALGVRGILRLAPPGCR